MCREARAAAGPWCAREHKLAVRCDRAGGESARERRRELRGSLLRAALTALVVVAAARRSHSTANIRASSAHTVRSRVSVTWDRVHFLRRCFFLIAKEANRRIQRVCLKKTRKFSRTETNKKRDYRCANRECGMPQVPVSGTATRRPPQDQPRTT